MEFEDPAALDDLLIGLPGFAAVHGLCLMPGGLAAAESAVCASAAKLDAVIKSARRQPV